MKGKTYTVSKYRFKAVKEPEFTYDKIKIRHRENVREFCKKVLSDLALETVCVIGLDNGSGIIGYQDIRGTTNQCSIYPNNVFRFLICIGAASFILAHNHPGGSDYPSTVDWTITDQLKKGGELLDIPLLDHIIITDKNLTSLRDSNRWRS